MKKFADELEYVQALENNFELAVLSMAMAARSRKSRPVTRAAIDRMVRLGQLEAVHIGGTRYVLAKSLIELNKREDDDVTKVRKLIEKFARNKRSLFYEPVMSILGLSHTVPADRTRIGWVLGAVSTQTHDENRFLLSALVHKKTGGKTRPGDGFFILAEELGYEGSDRDALVDQQTRRIFRYYETH